MIAGIDFSTRAVDIVLLDEDSDAATWHRFELAGQDAFERTRGVRDLFAYAPLSFGDEWESALAFGIEEPRGYNAGALYRIQGALLTKIPRSSLVQPWIPSAWRKTVGLPGNASKAQVMAFVDRRSGPQLRAGIAWPQDACDAYCIALATRLLLRHDEKAVA